MNALERGLRGLDGLQQRHRVPAFVFAVQKKVGDDNAGTLIAELAYAGFVSLFPLLLILLTVLGILAGNDPALARAVERSTLAQFPIIGTELSKNITALHRHSAVSLAVGLVGLAWGATGLSNAAMHAMAEVWSLPGVARFGFLARTGRAFLFLLVLALAVIVSGFLSGYGVLSGQGALVGTGAELVSAVVGVGAYLVSFRVLTPKAVRLRQLVPGAVLGGIGWTVLQAAGGYLVARDLKHAGDVYGFFAIVLGLLAWLYLAARLAVYSAEVSSVLAYRLWPRSILQPPLLEADRRSLTLQATATARRPEQVVEVSYDPSRTTPDEGSRASPSPDAPYARSSLTAPAEPVPARDGPGGGRAGEQAAPRTGD